MKTLDEIIRPFYTLTGIEREVMIQEINEHPDGAAYWAILGTDISYPLGPESIHTCHDALDLEFTFMCMASALVRLKAYRDKEKLIDLQMREDNHAR